MQVRVARTSDWNDGKPIPQAVRVTVEMYDIRTFSMEGLKKRGLYDSWAMGGVDHEDIPSPKKNLQDGESATWCRCVRTVPVWVVELESLEELVDFLKMCGECVISSADHLYREGPQLEVEIYDTYRE